MLNLLPKYLENRFITKVNTIANPAPGANFTITVPANKIWIPISFFADFSCDATVISRYARFFINDGTDEIAHFHSAASFAANGNYYISAFNGSINTAIAGTSINCNLPSIPMQEGFKLFSTMGNMQAGDQLSNIRLTVLEADITQP